MSRLQLKLILALALIASGRVVFAFFPAIEGWVSSSETSWYRPYLLWLLVILGAVLIHRLNDSEEP